MSLDLVSLLFLAIVALTVAACAQIVGILLVFMLTAVSAAAAGRLTMRLGAGVALAWRGRPWPGLARDRARLLHRLAHQFQVDQVELEAELVEAGRSWTDRLEEALVDAHGEEGGLSRFRRYASAFPLGYRERFSAAAAVFDMERAEEALTHGRLAINLYRPIEAPASQLRLKLYAAGGQLTLSDVLPTLEHMGLRVLSEMPFQIFPAGATSPVWLHDFRMETAEGGDVDIFRRQGGVPRGLCPHPRRRHGR